MPSRPLERSSLSPITESILMKEPSWLGPSISRFVIGHGLPASGPYRHVATPMRSEQGAYPDRPCHIFDEV